MLEALDTRESFQGQLLNMSVGVASILIASRVNPRHIGWAGWVYFLIGPLRWAHGGIMGRRRKKLEKLLA
ncbi:MAG: hypothetical protein HY237_06855 [Acidobacteria bacterium]|nr:hypothetical protein [Acidobacteriota bacterium]